MINAKEKYYRAEDQEILSELENQVSRSQYLPKYHIYPKAGLMNDPNGLAYFEGKYHVFFQWYPFDAVHGLKHWGHTASKDLIHWSDQEIALIPDQEFEKNGCYSGNAIEHDGHLFLFYTANYKTSAGKIAKQAMAIMSSDGKIEKLDKPIIDGAPDGLSGELRDPFVFKRNQQFYMLLGGGKFNGVSRNGFGDEGVLLIYQSENLYDWHYLGLIDLPIDTGYMLECPSLIKVDGQDVLMLSPMGISETALQFKNRFATVQLVGHLDIENLKFVSSSDEVLEIDSGFDYYAPQAFYGEHHQAISFAWFGCGEPIYTTDQEKWKHGLTMPQKLTINANKLYRFPVPELLAAFDELTPINSKDLQIESRYYRLHLEGNYNIAIGDKNDKWTLKYDSTTSLVTLSRAGLAMQIDSEYGELRQAKIEKLNAVDIFVDNSFVEIYLNEGERTFSFRSFQDNVGKLQLLDCDTRASYGQYKI
ncbi:MULTISPECIES: sucrose-6-phosphate hydrolase [unclassified Enterococcus]|uniref:glycoside hydrolase family 32 protein n=1 Tax=unclassified Enterococcus TaxID=2608891 RepID=UPI001551C5C2|nr:MULTISPECIES: sucrose-6-phosphate hydrolase [unclassified Enterococcus]MBS7578027.1 sucrose-6-phosphate hydrolase [Enterococcus sp. MMGLQ5-2]MBS7585283.1 sucrose-6-phosphate hydrolase [Enterococcus sp. MMGLQ5-1]NPD13140.1 sucrose-6-phosphate hydrolase [Enterococcus sp. MMGLQ5-1]NPD37858.1 sucrose-6-phosphate hydrolase [Enterococcus sp. MMGLQ5-2]